MANHAKLSPSSADRWLTCTASVALESGMPDSSTSYAEEGTLAHELAEYSTKYALGMIGKRELNKALKSLKANVYYSADMQDYIDEYSQYIKRMYKESLKGCNDAFCELEVKLDLTSYVPEGFGTGDCIIVAEPTLHVIDLKYGKGVEVEVENNSQLKLYALGALERYKSLYDITDVITHIVQPRINNFNSASYSVEYLEDWGETLVKPKAKEAFEGEGVFVPSEKACRFCKACGVCKARAKEIIEFFDNHSAKSVDVLTEEDFAEILPKLKDITTWIIGVEKAATAMLYEGHQIEGYKLVEGRTNRRYTDEDKVNEILAKEGYKEEEIFTKKLIGITAMEKLLGKKLVAELIGNYIEKPAGAPTMAHVSDRRSAIDPAGAIINAFDEE